MREHTTTDTNADDELATDEARRSFMKKGALVTGAAALGLTGASGSAVAQASNPDVLIHAYNYFPRATFRVVSVLAQSTTVRALKRPNGSTVPEIQLPSDYNGYIINFRIGGGNNVAGIDAFLYTKQSLNTGSRYRLGADAQVFSTDLNLLQASANRRSS